MLTTREQEFLAKAKDADEQAEKAASQFVKDAWLRIADNYRQLANYKKPERDV